MVRESRHFLPLRNMPSRIFHSVANLADLQPTPSEPVFEHHSAEDITALPPSATSDLTPAAVVSGEKKQSRFRRIAHKAKKMLVKKKKVEPVQDEPARELTIGSPTDFHHVSTEGVHGLRDATGQLPKKTEESVKTIPRKPVPKRVCTPAPVLDKAQSEDGSTITGSK